MPPALTLDIFNDDAFSVTALAAAINTPPEGQQVPCIIDDLYEESGIATTTVMVERKGDVLSMVAAHPDVKNAWQRWQSGEALRNDPRAGFQFAGINWLEYYGQVNGIAFIAGDEAYLIP